MLCLSICSLALLQLIGMLGGSVYFKGKMSVTVAHLRLSLHGKQCAPPSCTDIPVVSVLRSSLSAVRHSSTAVFSAAAKHQRMWRLSFQRESPSEKEITQQYVLQTICITLLSRRFFYSLIGERTNVHMIRKKKLTLLTYRTVNKQLTRAVLSCLGSLMQKKRDKTSICCPYVQKTWLININKDGWYLFVRYCGALHMNWPAGAVKTIWELHFKISYL